MNAQHTPEFTRGRLVQAAIAVVSLTTALSRTYDVASDIEVERGNHVLTYLINEFRILLESEGLKPSGALFSSNHQAVDLAKVVIYTGLGYIPEV